MDEALNSRNDLKSEFGEIPDNFPRPNIASGVAGTQAKIALVKYSGKFYIPGSTPPELFSRWDICEDLARHLVVKSTESKAGKRSHMSEIDILDQYFHRLLETGWGSEDEMRWVIRRTATLLEWTVPSSCTVDMGRKKCDQ